MAAVALVAIVLGLGNLLFIDNRPLDIPAWAISSLAGHSTAYAEGYSEARFRSIRPGMTLRQVEELMGDPLNREQWLDFDREEMLDFDKGKPSIYIWYYTEAGRPTSNHWRKQVWFRDGRVTMTVSDYLW
jgi:hypothetical protein